MALDKSEGVAKDKDLLGGGQPPELDGKSRTSQCAVCRPCGIKPFSTSGPYGPFTFTTRTLKVVNTLVEKQQLMSRPLREFPQFQSRCHEHSKQWQQDAGPCLDMPAFAHFVTDELYEQGNYARVHAAFDQMEEFLRDGNQEVRDLVALGFLETLHDVASAKPYGSEAFVRFFGPQTRHVWAGLDAIWRTSLRLDLADRSVLEAEVLAWRILRQSLY